MVTRPTGAALLGIVAAGAIVVGVTRDRWWIQTTEGEEGQEISSGIGVRSVTTCKDDDCETRPLASVYEDQHASWRLAGTIAHHAGLAAAGLLGLAGLCALIGMTHLGPIFPARIAEVISGVTLVAAVAFVILAPGDITSNHKMNLGLPLCGMGGLFGVVAGWKIASQRSELEDS